MNAYGIAAVVIGSWTILGFLVAIPFGRAIRMADNHVVQIHEPLPPVRPTRPPTLPEVSPLDLTGYELDAAFYATLAPSFREYH